MFPLDFFNERSHSTDFKCRHYYESRTSMHSNPMGLIMKIAIIKQNDSKEKTLKRGSPAYKRNGK